MQYDKFRNEIIKAIRKNPDIAKILSDSKSLVSVMALVYNNAKRAIRRKNAKKIGINWDAYTFTEKVIKFSEAMAKQDLKKKESENEKQSENERSESETINSN